MIEIINGRDYKTLYVECGKGAIKMAIPWSTSPRCSTFKVVGYHATTLRKTYDQYGVNIFDPNTRWLEEGACVKVKYVYKNFYGTYIRVEGDDNYIYDIKPQDLHVYEKSYVKTFSQLEVGDIVGVVSGQKVYTLSVTDTYKNEGDGHHYKFGVRLSDERDYGFIEDDSKVEQVDLNGVLSTRYSDIREFRKAIKEVSDNLAKESARLLELSKNVSFKKQQ